jgi:hypothetical protein
MGREAPGFIERNAATLRNAAALGFLALAGAAILAPSLAASVAGTMETLGLAGVGSDIAHNQAKSHRLRNQ